MINLNMMGVAANDMAFLYDQGTQKKIGIGLVSYYIFRQLSIFNLIFLIFLFFAGKKYYEDMKKATRRHQGLEQ